MFSGAKKPRKMLQPIRLMNLVGNYHAVYGYEHDP